LQLRFTGRFLHQLIQQYIQLDSIRIENLTQACDTLLYWPDTVLLLPFSGISNQQFTSKDFGFSRPFPPPFPG